MKSWLGCGGRLAARDLGQRQADAARGSERVSFIASASRRFRWPRNSTGVAICWTQASKTSRLSTEAKAKQVRKPAARARLSIIGRPTRQSSLLTRLLGEERYRSPAAGTTRERF